MVSQPGDLRLGIVSDRFSCAVKPPAAQTAAPSVPLPSGMNCDCPLLGLPSPTFERRTRFGVSTLNRPDCQAVVAVAA